MSESEAFHRITAARVGRQFPIVFSMIECRQIHLTAVCLLRDRLTADNHRELLAEASHKTKFQVQEIIARRFARADVASFVRKLPSAPVAERRAQEVVAAAQDSAPVPSGASQRTTHPTPPMLPTPARARIEPTSEARYRIQLNAGSALKEKLELFQALVNHSIPSGDVAAVLERALDLAIGRRRSSAFAQTDKPCRSRGHRPVNLRRKSKEREHIPNAVQREVAARDGLRCTFVSQDGCRCAARAFLQIHHENPWARGGESSVENLRLLCASHNRLLSERDFGAAQVNDRIAEARAASLQRTRPIAQRTSHEPSPGGN